MKTNPNAPTMPSLTSNKLVGVIVLAALLFLFLVRLGFRGLVVTP